MNLVSEVLRLREAVIRFGIKAEAISNDIRFYPDSVKNWRVSKRHKESLMVFINQIAQNNISRHVEPLAKNKHRIYLFVKAGSMDEFVRREYEPLLRITLNNKANIANKMEAYVSFVEHIGGILNDIALDLDACLADKEKPVSIRMEGYTVLIGDESFLKVTGFNGRVYSVDATSKKIVYTSNTGFMERVKAAYRLFKYLRNRSKKQQETKQQDG